MRERKGWATPSVGVNFVFKHLRKETELDNPHTFERVLTMGLFINIYDLFRDFSIFSYLGQDGIGIKIVCSDKHSHTVESEFST